MLPLRFCSSSTGFASLFLLLSHPVFSSGCSKTIITCFCCSKKIETKRNKWPRVKETSRTSNPYIPQKNRISVHPLFKAVVPLPFLPRSNCLLSLLASSLSLCLRLICEQTIFDEANYVEVRLSGCVPLTKSSREKVVFLKFELPSTSKRPSTVLCSISQFQRHCCPGAPRPVPADDGSSFPCSGSILPSVFSSIQTLTLNDIPEQRDRGLEGWASVVITGAVLAGATARPLPPR